MKELLLSFLLIKNKILIKYILEINSNKQKKDIFKIFKKISKLILIKFFP